MNKSPVFMVSNQSMPPNCQAKCISAIAELASATEATIDLTAEVIAGKIEQIQAVFIDNGDNPQWVGLTCRATGQRVAIGAFYQGWIPILVNPGNEVFDLTTTGAVDVKCHFVNVPMPASVWITF